MSKGIASQNSLKALAYPLQQFIRTWGAQRRAPKSAVKTAVHTASRNTGGQSTGSGFSFSTGSVAHNTPPVYTLAALRGEGVLRTRFFGVLMDKIAIDLSPEQQVQLWQDWVENPGPIHTWVQRLGLAKALRQEAHVKEAAAANPSKEALQHSRALYTMLLDALSEQAPELLAWALEGYFLHLWKNRFRKLQEVEIAGQLHALEAKAPPVLGSKSKSKSAAVEPLALLREQVLRALRKRYGAGELRESFKHESLEERGPEADQNLLPPLMGVRFTLLYKPARAITSGAITSGAITAGAIALVCIKRPRLKAARIAAYQAALVLHAKEDVKC